MGLQEQKVAKQHAWKEGGFWKGLQVTEQRLQLAGQPMGVLTPKCVCLPACLPARAFAIPPVPRGRCGCCLPLPLQIHAVARARRRPVAGAEADAPLGSQVSSARGTQAGAAEPSAAVDLIGSSVPASWCLPLLPRCSEVCCIPPECLPPGCCRHLVQNQHWAQLREHVARHSKAGNG
jgi:hypothetical protein